MSSILGIIILVANLFISIGYCFFRKQYAKFLLGATLVISVSSSIIMANTEEWTQNLAMIGISVLILIGIVLIDSISSFLIGVVGVYQIATLFYIPSLDLNVLQWTEYLFFVVCVIVGIGAVIRCNVILPIVTGVIGAKLFSAIVVFVIIQYSNLWEIVSNISLKNMFSLQQQIIQTSQQCFWISLGIIIVLAGSGIFTQRRLEFNVN